MTITIQNDSIITNIDCNLNFTGPIEIKLDDQLKEYFPNGLLTFDLDLKKELEQFLSDVNKYSPFSFDIKKNLFNIDRSASGIKKCFYDNILTI